MVYFLVTTHFNKNTDNKMCGKYIQDVTEIVHKYGGNYIVRSENITHLGQIWKPDRVIIIEFDTREQLDACFTSEEYMKIAALRENSVDSRAVIIE